MSTRNNPETSHEAYKLVTPEMLTGHHTNILSALQWLGSGTYEEIAKFIGMEKHQVGRRLKELQYFSPHPLIYNTGEKRKTSTGRNAYVYKLVPEPATNQLLNQTSVKLKYKIFMSDAEIQKLALKAIPELMKLEKTFPPDGIDWNYGHRTDWIAGFKAALELNKVNKENKPTPEIPIDDLRYLNNL